MAKQKGKFPARLATHRSGSGVEWIEQHENGVLFWKFDEDGASGAFPVSVAAASDYFAEWGRDFDVSRLPRTPITDPYNRWA